PQQRRRLREFMVLLEICRHPLTEEQVARVDAYADALGEDGPGLRLARTLVRDGTARALADYTRFSNAARVSWAEPSLVEQYLRVLDEPDPSSRRVSPRCTISPRGVSAGSTSSSIG